MAYRWLTGTSFRSGKTYINVRIEFIEAMARNLLGLCVAFVPVGNARELLVER